MSYTFPIIQTQNDRVAVNVYMRIKANKLKGVIETRHAVKLYTVPRKPTKSDLFLIYNTKGIRFVICTKDSTKSAGSLNCTRT